MLFLIVWLTSNWEVCFPVVARADSRSPLWQASVMTSGVLTVGTDGSCLRNPNGPTGWAYIGDDGRYGCGGRASGTNQVGELMAILMVLRDCAGRPLRIESDSAYAIGCASTWKPGWQRAGYLRKTGPLANLDIIRELHDRLDSHGADVRFVKVKAHLRDESVHPLNVRADELAGRAARAAQSARADFLERGTWHSGVGPVPEPNTALELDPPPQPSPEPERPRLTVSVPVDIPAAVEGMLF
jgi:ribonuclease HI